MATRIAIAGCCGRMGRAVAAACLQEKDVLVTAAFEAAGHESVGKDYAGLIGQALPSPIRVLGDAKQAISQADVVIEFTLPEPTITHVQMAQELRRPIVIGTTGLSGQQVGVLKAASQQIPIIFSPNMSLGVNLLFEIAQLAAQRLGLAYDVEIIEAHHHLKKDSPSGTAKRLAEAVAAGRKQAVTSVPIHAVRAGDIVGDHTVILAGPAERLELTHRAQSREVFARGAVKAAQFLASHQQPGLYDMAHVLKAA